MKKVFLSIVWFLAWLPKPGHTQLYKIYNLHPSPVNEQLLQNTIIDVCKDDMGFLWVSTQFGIYRYDGQNLQPVDDTEEGPIGSRRFSNFYADSHNQALTIANEEERFYIRNGRIHKIPTRAGRSLTLSVSGVYEIDTRKLTPAVREALIIREIKTPLVSQLMFFEKDTLIGNNGRLFNITTGTLLNQTTKDTTTVTMNTVGKVFQVKKDGVYRLSFANNRVEGKKIIAATGGNAVILNRTNTGFWFNTHGWLQYFDAVYEKVTKQINMTGEASGTIFCVYETDNTVYIGTSTKGLLEASLYKGGIFKSDTRENVEQIFYSYAFNPGRNEFYSGSSSGLYKLSTQQSGIELLLRRKMNSSVICMDNQGHLWTADYSDILIDFDIGKKKQLWSRQFDDKIWQVAVGDDGFIYCVTSKKLYRINRTSYQIDTVYTAGADEKLQSFCFFRGQPWFGTTSGLIAGTGKTGGKHFLNGEFVRCMLPLNNRQLLVGTYGKGSFLIEGDRIYHLPSDRQGINSAVVGLAREAGGDVWVICNKGAFVWSKGSIENYPYNPQNTYSLFLGTDRDLPTTELNGASFPAVFPSGKIVLPSMNGLLVFEKKDIPAQPNHPVILRSVSVDDSVQDIHDIVIRPDHRSIQFKLDVPYFASGNNFNLMYRIHGLDSQWRNLNPHRTINVNTLPAGGYTLEIRYRNEKDISLSVPFRVSPYWFQTLYFYAGAFLLLALLIYFFIRARTASITRKKEFLEKLVTERTLMLKDKIEIISKSEQEISELYENRNKLYSVLMHDLKSPLQFLSNLAIDQYLQMEKANAPGAESISTIADSIADMDKFINDFLFWLQSQNQRKKIHITRFDITSVIGGTTDLYRKICLLKKNILVFFFDPNPIYISSDKELIKVVARNIIDNANKNSSNGVIKVSCFLTPDEKSVTIKMEDSGNGLPEYVLQAFSPGTTLDKEKIETMRRNYKMGVFITREFINTLQGTIVVNSSPETGTCFEITLPVEYKDQEM